VDVIIGGDSHTLLGDFKAVGLPATGTYPTVVKNKSGETGVHRPGLGIRQGLRPDEREVRRRRAAWPAARQGQLVIGDSFKRKDSAGCLATPGRCRPQALVAKLAAHAAVKVVTPDAAATQTLATYASQVAAQKAITIGTASEPCAWCACPAAPTAAHGRGGCETANTLARGSDAAQVVAEAFLRASKRADFALQNAGGVRVPVPPAR
jgi:5'-nucleotidase/UDP-sugar diphosphatase